MSGVTPSRFFRGAAGFLTLFFAAAFAVAHASPITFPVICNSMTVGNVSIDTSPGGTGVQGSFTSTTGGPPATLAAAAAACGEDHFNWYQIVTADNMPPMDSMGNTLTPPYVDPPPGGYSDQWADNVPWYWDETAPAPGTPNYDPNLQLSNQTTADTLNFADFPGGAAGTNLMFRTWLVSLNANSSFHAFYGGFSWDWSNSTGTSVASNLATLGGLPNDAEYKDLIGAFDTSIPEPSTFCLFVVALGMLLFQRKRRRC